jgi:uncharacterized protein YukE
VTYLEVDPELLAKRAVPYRAAAITFNQIAEQTQDILARYDGAWGGDSMGESLGASIRTGFADLTRQIVAAAKRLDYVADGLDSNSHDFRGAEHHAVDASGRLLRSSQD